MASILSITNVFDKEQKRKNRWSLRFNGIPVFNDPDPFNGQPTPTANVRVMSAAEIADLELSLSTASRPNVGIGEVEFHRLNEKYYYPAGKAEYQPMEIAFYDTIGLNAGKFVYDWFRAVFDYKTGAVGYKKAFVAEGILVMLDPKGVAIERWNLVNCWPTTVNFNELSYEDTAAAMVNVTIRYDRAIPQFGSNYAAGASVEQLVAGSAFGVPGPNTFNQGLQPGGGMSVGEFPGPGG